MSYYFVGQQGLTGAPVSGSNANFTGTLTVGGASTLAAVSATTLNTSALATLASAAVTAGLTVGTTLGVTGTSTLAGVNAGATATTTLSSSGLATLNSVSVTTTLGVTGVATAATFNASTHAAAYAIGGNTVLESDGSSVYISPSNDTTGGVFLYTGGAERLAVLSTGEVRNAATASYTWNGLTQLVAPVNGQLQVGKATLATAPTTLVSGIIVGPKSSSGQSLVYDSTFGWRSMSGDQGLNSGFAGVGFAAVAANTFYGMNSGTPCGMNVTSNSAMDLRANAIVGLALSSTAQVSAFKPLTVLKTSAAQPTLTAADSYTVYHNTGSGAQVIYTLPTAAIGLTYTFINTAAGATFSKVLAVGTDKIAQANAIGGNAGALVSITNWSSVTIVCYVAGMWMVTANGGGVWTLT